MKAVSPAVVVAPYGTWIFVQQCLRADCQVAASARGSQEASIAPLTCEHHRP